MLFSHVMWRESPKSEYLDLGRMMDIHRVKLCPEIVSSQGISISSFKPNTSVKFEIWVEGGRIIADVKHYLNIIIQGGRRP